MTGGGTATLIDSNIYDNNGGLRIDGKQGVYNYDNYDNNGNPEWLYDTIGTVTLINTSVYNNEVYETRSFWSSAIQSYVSQSYLTRFNIHNQGILSITLGHIGAGMDLGAGSTTTYILPAPPGHWLPASKCEVQREDPDCQADYRGDACRAAAVSCLTNTTDNVDPCTASTGSSCKPTTAPDRKLQSFREV